jgi:hypothetical protein
MITIHITLPTSVYAAYSDAAVELNQRFGNLEPRLEPKTLIAFALARNDCADVCAQFDFALRIASAEAKPLPNPVLK